jgi:D-alanyl-D-alanine-carboxypeptidase/D-alanyl-D-alanine-endopeptidase
MENSFLRRMIPVCFAVIFQLFSFLSYCIASPPDSISERDAKVELQLALKNLDSILEFQQKSNGYPSLSVAVIHDGDIIYKHAFGYSDLENQIPATTNTIYPIASITQIFTSTMLM